MFVLAHTGIGCAIVRPWRKTLSRRMVLLGTVLPDVLDKSVYYIVSLIGGHAAGTHLLASGTRGFAHTAFFLLILSWISIVKGSRALASVSLGVATHLLLDGFGDTFGPNLPSDDAGLALFWPFAALSPSASGPTTATYALPPFFFWAEVIGFVMLVLDLGSAALRRSRDDRSLGSIGV